jgi:hypothetical protein
MARYTTFFPDSENLSVIVPKSYTLVPYLPELPQWQLFGLSLRLLGNVSHPGIATWMHSRAITMQEWYHKTDLPRLKTTEELISHGFSLHPQLTRVLHERALDAVAGLHNDTRAAIRKLRDCRLLETS